PLALPLIELELTGGGSVAVFADPLWGTTFSLERATGEVVISADWALDGERVPFRSQARSIAIVLHRAGFERALDAFFAAHAPQRRQGGVPMSVVEVRRRLEEARALGFRTLLYFADGMVADSTTVMGARAGAELGRSGWNGPEVMGELRIQNPADPAVRRWFL